MSPARRPVVLLGLCIVVTAAHLWLTQQWMQLSRLGDGAAASALRRIEVVFVRELAPAAPPAAPAAAVRRAPRFLARPASVDSAASAASAASTAAAAVAARVPLEVQPPAESPPPPAPPQANLPELLAAAPSPAPAPAPAPDPAAAIEPVPAAVAAASAAITASAPVAFEWPPSTRLAYTLTGDYRGPVDGTAQVEWLRSGTRYQVHLDVRIGPSFAPIITRRMSSEGELTDQGLRPLRYEEETKILLRDARRVGLVFEADRIVLANGSDIPTLPGVQDPASQFVQLTWLFTTQPERLRVGQSVEIPLALARRVDRWVYDVAAQETLVTPAGAIPTFHLKPRREAQAGSDLVADAWFAPSLQYLPVRIRIRQDKDTYVDMLLERLPQQAAPPR